MFVDKFNRKDLETFLAQADLDARGKTKAVLADCLLEKLTQAQIAVLYATNTNGPKRAKKTARRERKMNKILF